MEEREDEIGAQHSRPVQAKTGRRGGWTKAKRETFLTELAASCNIRRASAVAGMWSTSAYKLRQREPEFARAWQAALAIGYERLEAALIARALEAVGEIAFDTLDERVAMVEKMTVDQAIRILGLHRESMRRGQPRGAARVRVAYRAGIAEGANGIPEAIRQGIVRMTQHLHDARDGAGAAPPAAIAALWQPWRRLTLGGGR